LEHVGGWRIDVLIMVASKHTECHQRIEGVAGASAMQLQPHHQRVAAERPIRQFGEQADLDSAQQGLRPQKPNPSCRIASGET
jgi:hypothetical protein